MRTPRAHGRDRRRAFTLVELLVVIALIGILATLVVSVGSTVRDKAAENETRAMLKIVQGAIDSYRDARGGQAPGCLVEWRSSIHPSFDPSHPDYDTAPNREIRREAAKANSWWLREQLNRIQDAENRIAELPGKFFVTDEVCRQPAPPNFSADRGQETFLVDSFGNPINYQPSGGAGGTPVVISAGANGRWGDADDLRSDDL